MKPFAVILFALVLSLVSCKKDDPDQIPVFTCGDSTDDGKFETWNEAEKLLFRTFTHPNPEAATVTQTVSINRTVVGPSDSLIIHFTLPPQTFGRATLLYSGETTFTRLYNFSGTAQNIDFRKSGSPMPGCGRLYYIFHDTSNTIVNKGHFDIQFN